MNNCVDEVLMADNGTQIYNYCDDTVLMVDNCTK